MNHSRIRCQLMKPLSCFGARSARYLWELDRYGPFFLRFLFLDLTSAPLREPCSLASLPSMREIAANKSKEHVHRLHNCSTNAFVSAAERIAPIDGSWHAMASSTRCANILLIAAARGTTSNARRTCPFQRCHSWSRHELACNGKQSARSSTLIRSTSIEIRSRERRSLIVLSLAPLRRSSASPTDGCRGDFSDIFSRCPVSALGHDAMSVENMERACWCGHKPACMTELC